MAKNKNQQLPLPLRAVKEFADKYPGCWDKVEFVRDGKGGELPDWDDICYVPLAGTQGILSEMYGDKNLNTASLFAALASWRQYKEIYTFSDELLDMLYSQSGDDIKVPVDILYQIPYQCIYIGLSQDDAERGVFVFFEQDMETFEMELRFTLIEGAPGGGYKLIGNHWLHIKDGWTISDGMDAARQMMLERNADKPITPAQIDLQVKHNDKIVRPLLQLVLYICAANADIEENPEQKNITRKPSKGTKPKDAFREIQKWDVGVKISRSIRRAKGQAQAQDQEDGAEQDEPNGSGKNKSHRPHTRRGHWHHFWIGKKDGPDRKLILHWIAPMFINGGADDIIATNNIID